MTARFDWRARAKAASIHLAGSAVVAALAAALVFLVWYPAPFHRLAGGAGLFTLLVSVDIAIGPLITFAVFNRGKPRTELVRDLGVVVLLQLAALGYGVVTMFGARPVALVLEGPRFRVVAAAAVQDDELARAMGELRTLPVGGPRLLRTEAPTDPAEKFEAIQLAIAGRDLGLRPKYWRPWDDQGRAEARSAALPLAELQARLPAAAGLLERAAQDSGRPVAQLKYLPIISRFADAVALIDGATGEIVGYAPVNGF